jgi:hypothetical protein
MSSRCPSAAAQSGPSWLPPRGAAQLLTPEDAMHRPAFPPTGRYFAEHLIGGGRGSVDSFFTVED